MTKSADLFEKAQQIFFKIIELLETHQQEYSGPQWNSFLLKVVNNLAVSHYKLRRNDEALHLLKSLSTARGNFGQIIECNLQACTA